jgi:ABC-type lipoprotein release transport system permease subunit
MVASVTDVDLGDVQVHRPGYIERRSLTLAFDDGVRLARAAERDPGVTAAAARAYAWGFVTMGGRSIGVQLVGIEPPHEARVTRLARAVQSGAFLPDRPTPWRASAPLTAEQQKLDANLTDRARAEAIAQIEALGAAGAGQPPKTSDRDASARAEARALLKQQSPPPDAPLPILIGDGLAARLRVGVGSTVTVLAQDARGVSAEVDARVAGIYHTGDDGLDRDRLVFNLVDLQHLLALGDRAHEIAIRVDDRGHAHDVAHSIAADRSFSGLAVASWDELRPDLVAMVAVDAALTDLIVAVVFVLAGLGVVSSMLMAVFERRREFGVLRALGLEPRAMVAMVAVETLFLSAASATMGVVVGGALDVYLARYGLDVRSIGRFSLAGVGFEPVLHAAITPRGLLMPVVAMMSVAALGSLFPAAVAARIQPAVGMREA